MINIKENKGVTLIELLISSGLFIVLVSLASGTFIQALKTQRTVTHLSESMNNISFATEQIAREIRTSFSFQGGNGQTDTLSFTDSDGDNIRYKRITFNGGASHGIGRCVGSCSSDANYDPITSKGVEVSDLKFILQGVDSGDGEAPRVTILTSVEEDRNISINMQATISSRLTDS